MNCHVVLGIKPCSSVLLTAKLSLQSPYLALKKKKNTVFYLFTFCVCEVHTIACMWQSEDNFQEFSLPPSELHGRISKSLGLRNESLCSGSCHCSHPTTSIHYYLMVRKSKIIFWQEIISQRDITLYVQVCLLVGFSILGDERNRNENCRVRPGRHRCITFGSLRQV